jgi:hypothetical protein
MYRELGAAAAAKAGALGKIDNSFTPASRPPLYCFISLSLFGFLWRNHHG